MPENANAPAAAQDRETSLGDPTLEELPRPGESASPGEPWTPRAEPHPPLEPIAPVDAESPESDVSTVVETYIETAMDAILSGDPARIRDWFFELLQSPPLWIDGGFIVLALVLARFAAHRFERGKLPRLASALARIPTRSSLRIFRLFLLLATWLLVLVAELSGLFAPLLRVFSLILTIFVFTTLPSKLIRWKSWMSFFSSTVFVLATLHILGLLDNTVRFLDGLSLDLGELRLSALNLIEGLGIFLVLFWLAGFLSTRLSRKLERAQDLPSHITVLISKTVRIFLFVLAILVTMNVLGIKITTLAVFGGALGLGLGFGLQKVVSNLVSGIILLLDRSIKPGDVIEIGDTYGSINSLNLRYVSVVTRDHKEHLIPNEDIITHPVVNWSFSDQLLRVRAPFGISYGSDPRLAMELAVDCARRSKRVVEQPAPSCNLMGFGNSSLDFELRFWIVDPQNGVGNTRSEVLLAIWDAFHEHGIEFPFPQRDVHLRLPSGPLAVDLSSASHATTGDSTADASDDPGADSESAPLSSPAPPSSPKESRGSGTNDPGREPRNPTP